MSRAHAQANAAGGQGNIRTPVRARKQARTGAEPGLRQRVRHARRPDDIAVDRAQDGRCNHRQHDRPAASAKRLRRRGVNIAVSQFRHRVRA